ncbi:MAG: hypothetical protein ACR2O0_05850 [Rhizobiaceae bacterium]
MRSILLTLAALLFLCGSQLRADGLLEFNEQVELANRPYISSLFYLRTGNAGLASLELSRAIANWEKVVTGYKTNPPEQFQNDAAWGDTIDQVLSVLNEGANLTTDGDAKAARKILLPIRKTLHELRKRNGATVLADCIFDLNDHMSVLYHYRHNAPDFSDPTVRNTVKTVSENYRNTLNRCREQADPALQNDADFRSIFDSTTRSANNLFKLIEDKNTPAFINVLREIMSFDVMIALRWG